MLLTTLGQRSTGSCPSGTQLSPQDSCLGCPPCPELDLCSPHSYLTGSVGIGMSDM